MNNFKYVLKKMGNIDYSKLLIIFDIDGVLLRPSNNRNRMSNSFENTIEFSPIITELFELIDRKNIKYSIATHGGNHIMLQQDFSPIHNYIRKLDSKYIKHISMPQYNLWQNKINMLNDLISQGISDYNIKHVMFIDDDPSNLKSFNQLQFKYNTLKFIPIQVDLNLVDVNNNYTYPLLRTNSFSRLSTSLEDSFENLLSM